MGKNVNIKLGANITDFQSKMRKAQKSFKRTAGNLKKIGKSMSMSLTLPLTAFAAASVKAFDTQAKAEAKLSTALKGNKTAFKELTAQARELQKVTIFGDEETIAAQSMLASMGLEEEAIKRLTPLIQDMATAKGMNLSAAADLVAKSVGSSTNALSRYGIQIEGEVGSTERLNSAVEALSGQFKGQAKAAAKAGAGGLKQLQNRFGDLMEQVGAMLLPVLNSLIDWVDKAIVVWNNLDSGLKVAIVTFAGILAALGPIVTLFGTLGTAIAFIVSPVGLVIAGIAALSAAIIFLHDNWAAVVERISDVGWWQNALIDMINLFIELNPFNLMIEGFNKVLSFFGKAELPNPFQSLQDSISTLKTETKEYQNEFGSFSDAVSNAANTAKEALMGMGSALGVSTGGSTGGGGESGGESGGGDTGGGVIGGLSAMEKKIISLKDATKEFALTIANDFANSFSQAIVSGENFLQSMSQIFKDIAKQILAMIIKAAILAAVFSMIPGLGAAQTASEGSTGFLGLLTGSLTGKASGGNVVAGQPYMVGESGAEIFIPGQSGTIIPNGNIGGSTIPDVKISGEDLIIVFDRANKHRNSLG
tara:strand:+ start:736 stop:2511 length:1776 start_codon:yes stop_codon:yes gene_type:complete